MLRGYQVEFYRARGAGESLQTVHIGEDSGCSRGHCIWYNMWGLSVQRSTTQRRANCLVINTHERYRRVFQHGRLEVPSHGQCGDRTVSCNRDLLCTRHSTEQTSRARSRLSRHRPEIHCDSHCYQSIDATLGASIHSSAGR
jgi:hypothetical protein